MSTVVCGQCDQMLEWRIAQLFPKVALKVATVALHKSKVFQIAKKLPIIWVTFVTNFFLKNRLIWSHWLRRRLRTFSKNFQFWFFLCVTSLNDFFIFSFFFSDMSRSMLRKHLYWMAALCPKTASSLHSRRGSLLRNFNQLRLIHTCSSGLWILQ